MDISEELGRMIVDMQSRTGGCPERILCSQDTLNQLWEQTRMIYVSQDDIENERGYVARYMGIPISVSPGMEPGKVCLIPRSEVHPQSFGVDFSSTSGPNVNGWFTNNPFTSPDTGWQVRIDPLTHPVYQSAFNLDAIPKEPDKKTDTSDEPDDIDEDSFIDILKGGSGHDDAGSI